MTPRLGKRTGGDETAKLGIMGGTFDPIHYGHLVAAEEARVRFRLDRVLFVPTGRYAHKEEPLVSAEDRYIMTVIATAANGAFAVSRLETDRQGPAYTVDTVKVLRREYSGAEIYFITGADAILDVANWQGREELSEYCRFIAATRPGYDLRNIETLVEKNTDIPEIEVIEVPSLAISSTDLRRRIKEGRSIRYLVPDSVAEYISKSGFYL